MKYPLVIGKNAKFNEAGQLIKAPDTVKVFMSSFDRDMRETIKFEGETWNILSCGFDKGDEAGARLVQREMVKRWVRTRAWNGSRSVTAKF
jgi:hypothetical protein